MLSVLTTLFLSNSVDYGQLKTGRREESVIFSMQTFVVKAASGVAVFLTGDAQADARARAAASFLAQDAQVQQVLGDRAMAEDGAVWLPAIGAHPQGSLLRTLLAQALGEALMQGRSAAAALRRVTQALDAAK